MDSYVKICLLVMFLFLTSVLAYVIIEPIMCYWTELPMDMYQDELVPLNLRVNERIKQVWAYNLLPYSDSVIEFGCGNGLTTMNLATRQPKTHIVHVDNVNKVYLDNLDISRFQIQFNIKEACSIDQDTTYHIIIVHQDGKLVFWEHIIQSPRILVNASYILLDTEKDFIKLLQPILNLYKFTKQKTYINLSIWVK